MRCRVDGKWRTASNVNSADLTDAELREARSHPRESRCAAARDALRAI
jgi:hypothetical protein